MATVEVVESCVAPGGQPVLFHAPTEGVPTYVVVDRCGVEHVHTGSLGVAASPRDGASDVVARADANLYRAKHAGRDRVAWS